MPYYDPATKPPPKCPSCGLRKDDVRKDPLTGLTQCNQCWFSTDPAMYGYPERK